MSLLQPPDRGEYLPRIDSSLTAIITIVTFCLILPLLLRLVLWFEQRRQQVEPEGCRKLGLRTTSNLADQHDNRYTSKATLLEEGQTRWRVKSLWIYPIKSCRGVELNQHNITGTGMEYDRQFSFAQLSGKFPVSLNTPYEEKAKNTWKFLTQRTLPALAMVITELWVPDPSSPTYSENHPNVRSGGVLVIKFPQVLVGEGLWGKIMAVLASFGPQPERTVHIPLDPTQEQILELGYGTDEFEIWKDKPRSLVVASTEKNDTWIQELRYYLGITNHLALFRVSQEQLREVYRCAPRKEELGYQSRVSFQDAYPLHILNLASVRDVGRKMEKGAPPLGALNFRPNIIITGGDPYEEDSWKRVKVGDYEHYVACRTVRCLLPNVNPATGKRHGSEPNRTLKRYRRVDEGDAKNACLGMQMVPALEDCKIKVGDEITVLETGEHFYIKQ